MAKKNWLTSGVANIGQVIANLIPGYADYWNSITGAKKDDWHYVTKKNEDKTQPTRSLSNNVDASDAVRKGASALAGLLGGGGGSSSSGGGGGVANRIDMTPYINSLKEGAAANKKTISDTYASQRNQLATQLKQYQENTATARRQAMDAYNSARADLEEQAYMNMRAAQQSAASRGLGGSGLQQLAQLSSQIESSNQTSNLSEQNTDTQNELTKALKDMEQQINTGINDLTTEERNKLTEIDTNTAQAIAQAQYQEEVRYQQALAEAAARNAAIAAQRDAQNQELALAMNSYTGTLDALLKGGVDKLTQAFTESAYSKGNYSKKNADALNKELSSIYNEYSSGLLDALSQSGLGQAGSSYYDYYSQQLRNAYNMLSGNTAK